MKAFTNDTDPSSEGQIGNIPYARLCQVIGEGLKGKNIDINRIIDENEKQNGGKSKGNIREKYTAFYNAAYYKYVYDQGSGSNDKVVNFKNIMQEIAVNHKSELVDQLGLDQSVLETKKLTSTNPFKDGPIRSVYNSGILNKIMNFKGKIAERNIEKYQAKRDIYSSWRAKSYGKKIEKYEAKKFFVENFSKRFYVKDVYDLTLISLETNKLETVLDYLKNGRSFRFRSEEE